uniref:GntR family transcriptional regulator n=1 Tax=Orrella sp. TaxID=1921583 RepID=UPI004047F386
MNHNKSSDNSSFADFVSDRIMEKIRLGIYQQGDRLVEDTLAKEFNISRTPVREALGRLLSRGLLEVSGSRAITVKRLDRQQIVELYEMRAVIEGASARLAAKHSSRAEIYAIREIIENSNPQGQTSKFYAQKNIELHQAIVAAAHNHYLQQVSRVLNESLWLLAETTFALEDRHNTAYAEHLAIVEALEQGDQDAAETAARNHIELSLRARLSIGSKPFQN